MKRISIAVAVSLLVTWVGAAHARNPHCAGGIQYLTQWRADKEKGNTEDYKRELLKSIQQLEMCSTEDPSDFEALGYLGWSYAEADSAAAAGRAFDKAIQGLTAKGDKKSLQMVTNNRDSYWALAFNDGIGKIKAAQELYGDYCKTPANDEEKKQKAAAGQKYDEAVASLHKAAALKAGEVRTLKNLGTVDALRCDYRQAEAHFKEAMAVAPADSEIAQFLRSVHANMANELVSSKDYDKAIAFYGDLLKNDDKDGNAWGGLGDAYFERAAKAQGEAQAKDFKAAGDAYAKSAALRNNDPDLWYNAATAYQNAHEWEKAEAGWRARLAAKPDDEPAMLELGSVLAELKKFDDAIKVLHQAVLLKPQDKAAHRQLGAVYTKAGNNQKGTEELMVYLALQSGQPVADPAADAKKAPAGSVQAKTLSSAGTPEAVYGWSAENEKWQSWFYWNKHVAYHFKGGALAQKSDWTAPDLKTAGRPK